MLQKKMKFIFIPSFLCMLLLSCSQVNRESREYYEYRGGNFRHGVVPKETPKEPEENYGQPVNLASIKRGEVLYKNNCMSCHGKGGRGDGPHAKDLEKKPKNLALLSKEVPSFKFYMMVSKYNGKMPGWKNAFSKRDVNDLENYIRSLSR